MAEPAQRRVRAFPHQCVELVGVCIIEELLDLTFYSDLVQRLLDSLHEQHESQQHNKEQQHEQPSHDFPA